MSWFTCHVSCFMGHMSHVACHMSFFSSDKGVKLVGGGSVIAGATQFFFQSAKKIEKSKT